MAEVPDKWIEDYKMLAAENAILKEVLKDPYALFKKDGINLKLSLSTGKYSVTELNTLLLKHKSLSEAVAKIKDYIAALP